MSHRDKPRAFAMRSHGETRAVRRNTSEGRDDGCRFGENWASMRPLGELDLYPRLGRCTYAPYVTGISTRSSGTAYRVSGPDVAPFVAPNLPSPFGHREASKRGGDGHERLWVSWKVYRLHYRTFIPGQNRTAMFAIWSVASCLSFFRYPQ